MSLPIIMMIYYAALFDFKHCRIPNSLVYTVMLFSLIESIVNSSLEGSTVTLVLINAVIGLIVGLIICLSLYAMGLFGAGDAKLLASLGIILGPYNLIVLIAISITFAGLLSLTRLTCYGELKPMLSRWYQSLKIGYYLKPDSNTVASSAVPMGGAILLATVFCEFYMF